MITAYRFDKKNVVRYFMEESFNKITELIDFVKGSPKMLSTWEDHFVEVSIPYAVTHELTSRGSSKERMGYILWKRVNPDVTTET